MAKQRRSAFWQCPYFGTLYCLTGCRESPPCVRDPKWQHRAGCVVVAPKSMKRSICQALNCPCWIGSASTQLALSARRQGYLEMAQHFLDWCVRGEKNALRLPTYDLGIWLRTYERLVEDDIDIERTFREDYVRFIVLRRVRRHESPEKG